ncbi:hypothetical protein CFI11_04320 [Thalassococcus sp. S3]|nr:hypothetical protein CFI11_04320 [Thalassococcus sp. S3]
MRAASPDALECGPQGQPIPVGAATSTPQPALDQSAPAVSAVAALDQFCVANAESLGTAAAAFRQAGFTENPQKVTVGDGTIGTLYENPDAGYAIGLQAFADTGEPVACSIVAPTSDALKADFAQAMRAKPGVEELPGNNVLGFEQAFGVPGPPRLLYFGTPSVATTFGAGTTYAIGILAP